MRVVIDTNTAISGLLWFGAPRQVLDAAHAGILTIYSSRSLLAEFSEVIRRPKFASRIFATGLTIDELVDGFTLLVHRVDVPDLPPVVLSDPDDDAVVACALAAGASLIVTGDTHLLALGTYNSIEIITAHQLVARLPAG